MHQVWIAIIAAVGTVSAALVAAVPPYLKLRQGMRDISHEMRPDSGKSMVDGFNRQFTELSQKLDIVSNISNQTRSDVGTLKAEVQQVNQRVSSVEDRLSTIDKRFERVELDRDRSNDIHEKLFDNISQVKKQIQSIKEVSNE